MDDYEFWGKLVLLEKRYAIFLSTRSLFDDEANLDMITSIATAQSELLASIVEPKLQSVKQQEKLKRVLRRELNYLQEMENISMKDLRVLLNKADDEDRKDA